jgi:hypothetical protein
MLLQAAALPVVDAAVIDDAGTITVTATRLSDLAADAERCAKQGCPTRKDIAVSVAYASALFDDGKYLDAKAILARTVARTKAAAKAEPLALSTLYQAQATLAQHEGDQDTVKSATWASSEVLRDALPGDSLALLTADLRIADWQFRTGDKTGAALRYADITARAGAREIGDVAALRRAITLEALGQRNEAQLLLESLAARTGPEAATVRRAALATAAKMASDADDSHRADALVARLVAEPEGTEPMLVASAELPRPGRQTPDRLELVGVDRGAQGSALVGLRWVDIGYWIKPDGRVDDVRFLRGSPRLGWAQPLVGYINSRRYSPVTGGAGHYKVERYTLTANYGTPIGSLIRRRGSNMRYEVMAVTAAKQIAAAD